MWERSWGSLWRSWVIHQPPEMEPSSWMQQRSGTHPPNQINPVKTKFLAPTVASKGANTGERPMTTDEVAALLA